MKIVTKNSEIEKNLLEKEINANGGLRLFKTVYTGSECVG